MTATGTDHRSTANTEPRLLRIKVNGKACYAFKWHDERVETRREVNYVMRDPTTGKDQYLLINCPLRIAGSTELVSVHSIGRPTWVADSIVWESAETVWDDWSTADNCTIRFGEPETLPAYRNVLSRFKQMIREYDEGTGKCYDLTQSVPATSEIAPMKPVVTQPMASKVEQRKVARDARRQAAGNVTAKERAKKSEAGKKHGKFWNDDPVIRRDDKKTICAVFKRKKTQDQTDHAAAAEIAVVLSNESFTSYDKKTIKVRGVYPTVDAYNVLTLLGLRKMPKK